MSKTSARFIFSSYNIQWKFQTYFGSLRDFELISHFRYDKQFLMFYA